MSATKIDSFYSTQVKERRHQNRDMASLVRKRLRINESLAQDMIFKIAESHDELEQVYRLIHNTYSEEGYTDIHPSGMRINSYNAHPDTTIFIALKGNKVIMTLTLVVDSPFGLPMDKLYFDELKPLRTKANKIGRLCAFASKPEYRMANHTLPLFLMKIMWCYAKYNARLTHLLITVNPKHGLFYQGILLFKRVGELKLCHDVNGHPAYAYLGDLELLSSHYKRVYAGQPFEKNLHHFFIIKKHSNIKLPKNNTPLNIWDKEKLDYFFTDKTDTFKKTDKKYLSYILKKHSHTSVTETLAIKRTKI